jgi:beta-N-acetylhexosaminidase
LPILNKTLAELEKHEFIPFSDQKDNLAAVMVGHVMVPAIDKRYPASISPKLIRQLRNRIGFEGVIVTDDIKMGALTNKFGHKEIAIRAIRAGADMIIMAWEEKKQLEAVDAVEAAVRKGIINSSSIDRSVRRILKMKFKYAKNRFEL